MSNFLTTIERLYGRNLFQNHSYYDLRGAVVYDATVKYIEVPIQGDEFEVPCFAFNAFYNAVNIPGQDYADSLDALIATLHISPHSSGYKTLESIMKEIYLEGLNATGLMKVQLKPEDPVYYVSYGSIFNDELKPVAIHSWMMKKVYQEDGHFKYQFMYPLLRINPECFTLKTDPIQRFISGRLTTTTLNVNTFPFLRLNRNTCLIDIDNARGVHPRVLIEPCPYVLKETARPSISTTNQDLLQVALDHIDEVLQ